MRAFFTMFLLFGSALSSSAFASNARSNQFWWPNQLDLSSLRSHTDASNPYGAHFSYAKEFAKLDLPALKKEISALMKDSQDWWPADYGHYGPFFIRMAWHSAGTYRVTDGRGGAAGGQLRFEPLNSWPDNGNLDKARRLLWPIKKKYGKKISWADLMVLTGNVALESMGFETMGFAGGRTDDWEAEIVDWGPEKKFLDSKRHYGKRKLKKPLGATRMGLIYVNPEGPNGDPDPLKAAHDIRQAFGRMAMNDEETVALIAGGHTFGKAHGAKKPAECVGVEPAAAGIEQQGFGWKNKCGKGNGADTTTSGLEGAWTSNPTAWTSQFFDNLFNFTWVKTKSPAGATQWKPKSEAAKNLVPDAHDAKKRHAPVMFTTDLALKFDPSYKKVSMRFKENPKEFQKAFARAWFKLTHRDMGPRARYLGSEVPKEELAWQDPVPSSKGISAGDATWLKKKIRKTKLGSAALVRTAWASASTFRASDMRGGANGARIRLEPQKNWAANSPKSLATVLSKLEKIQSKFNKKGKKVSMADLIVLAGAVGVEDAAQKAGMKLSVPFRSGRGDASEAQTDAASFAVLEPKADAFRNYFGVDAGASPTAMMVEKAGQLTLNVPEMTVLIGGLRAIGANNPGDTNGLLGTSGALDQSYFVNLLDMSTVWRKSSQEGLYEGFDRKSGKIRWKASPVDLVFGSNAELRAVAEVYASDDAKQMFVQDFVKAWVKVMNLDRFDIK